MKSVKGLVIALVCMCAATSFGITVSMSGTDSSDDAVLIDFIQNNFQDVTLNYGDYSNPANIPVGTEVFMTGRQLSSSAYANSTNSATFNALTIPVVCYTSYVARPDDGRWGWHDGASGGGFGPDGAETTVTAAGAAVFDVAAGAYDWLDGDDMWGTGTGSFGDGVILATIGGTDVMAAGWNAGDLSGTGVTFGGSRLLFNLDEVSGVTIMGTAAAQAALTEALEEYTPLVRVPEPATMAILGLGALLIRRKR
jgi:hypothetical protein